jgi:hypothetical protein
MATDQQPAYQEVHGPVPSGPAVDADGLAQQTSGAAMPELVDSLALRSNIGPGVDAGFLSSAAQQQEERIAAGYAADGTAGGAFSRENPPPGMQFAGYKKGATGIQWRPAATPGSLQAPESHGTTPALPGPADKQLSQEPGMPAQDKPL